MMNTEVSQFLGHFFYAHLPSTVSLLHLSFAAMKKLLASLFALFIFCACNNSNQDVSAKPENDLDAARTFINDALDGHFEQARQLMLRDSTNEQTMDVIERNYERTSEENKQGYRSASIQIYNTRNIGDSVRIITYSNSYMNKKDSLKLVNLDGQWLIDLKFTFQAQH
jgi:hypothetical protein